MPLVKVLSHEAYGEKVSLIQGSDKSPVEKGKLLGKLAMLCREVSLNEQGKLLPRRLTGTSLKYQRKVAQAVKRARHLALMPYVADGLR